MGAKCPFKILEANSLNKTLALSDESFGPEGAKFDLVFSMQKQNSNIMSECFTTIQKAFSS